MEAELRLVRHTSAGSSSFMSMSPLTTGVPLVSESAIVSSGWMCGVLVVEVA